MPAQMLDITQDEGTVTIAHDGGPAMVIVTDGEFIEQLGPRGPVLTRAGWRDGSLIIEHTNPDPNSQMRAIERYVRIADDDSLQVIITLQQDEDASPVTMRRVYRPAPVAAP